MQNLLAYILNVLRGEDHQEVYPSFDAVPVSRKSTALFTVVSPESVQIEPVIPVGLEGTAVLAYPFSAVYKVSVLIPMTQPLGTAENYFYNVILPRMESVGSTLCDVLPAHADAALGRVVMQGKFRLRCLFAEGSVDA
jgi:hypothetical protein